MPQAFCQIELIILQPEKAERRPDMAEVITVSPIANPNIRAVTHRDRDEYYDVVFSKRLADVTDIEVVKAAVQYAPHVCMVLLFNRAGQLILQMRSDAKRHNPGMLDKTVGGHITWENHHDILWSLIQEMTQELKIPLIPSPRSLYEERARSVIPALDKFAFATQLGDPKLFYFSRLLSDGKRYIVPSIAHVYTGMYFGGVTPVDGEASGLAFRTLSQEQLRNGGMPVTDDLLQLINTHEQDLVWMSELAQKIGGM